jgi:hypothetical protein
MAYPISLLQPSLFSPPSFSWYGASARFRAVAYPISFLQPSVPCWRLPVPYLAKIYGILPRSILPYNTKLSLCLLLPKHLTITFFWNMRIISPYRVAQTTAQYMKPFGQYFN